MRELSHAEIKFAWRSRRQTESNSQYVSSRSEIVQQAVILRSRPDGN
jgi:hypothetical protein